jgi:hypothetical protein
MTCIPKPRRVGSATAGPPTSDQWNSTRPSVATDQSSGTAATLGRTLLHSSPIHPIAWAASGCSITLAPSATARFSSPRQYRRKFLRAHVLQLGIFGGIAEQRSTLPSFRPLPTTTMASSLD